MGAIKFIKETRGELKHVSWPSQSITVKFTAIVVAISVLVALLLYFYDEIFKAILKIFI